MSKLFHSFFDSFRVKNESPTIVHIGRNVIGSIEFYPSDTNPFMEEYGYVRVYDNGELFCDEHLAKLITYTDLHSEFMEFCFDLWKNKTNQKIYQEFPVQHYFMFQGLMMAHWPYFLFLLLNLLDINQLFSNMSE